MKRVVSVSLGSSKRDHQATVELLGETFSVERVGTDGSIARAVALVRALDGAVDAFGMGGIDLYVQAGGRRYTFRDARRIAAAATRSPIVDGTGLKHTLERRVVRWFDANVLPLHNRRVLMVSSVDRFGMAESMVEAGALVTHGDLMFGLGLPIPLRDLATVGRVARVALPLLTRLPFPWLYPTGAAQERRDPRFRAHFEAAEVVAGDFHYIARFMPERLPGRAVLTNTVTAADVAMLRDRGVATLVTTTPNLGGRSFGTNVMEALLIAAAGRRPEAMAVADYDRWLDRLDFAPRVERLGT